MRNRIQFLAVLLVLGMVATACGQKEGVHQGGRQVGFQPGAGDPATEGDFEGDFEEDFEGDFEEDFDPADSDFGEAETDTGTAPSGSGTAPSGGGSGRGSGTAPSDTTGSQPSGNESTGGQPNQQQPRQQPREQEQSADPNDSRGVSDSEIKIGVHAPLSGAAPLPQKEFESGRRMYWDHVGQVAGRTVNVVVRDDQYNPSRATSVCNDLIQREQVFILVGGGGADQIAACARQAAQQRVPYLSAGVDEGVLRQLPNYFALSMSYVQQAPLLAQYIEKHARPGDDKVALVRDRTPGFNNVVQRLQQELERRGMQSQVIQFRNAPATAGEVRPFETAFAIMAPSDFVQMVRAPGGDSPQWVGVGITMGLNTVASAACPGTNYRGMFFSPFPGLNKIRELDPDFEAANGQGDIELALWGLNKTIHEVLKRQGDTITRSSFIQVLQQSHQNPIRTNVYPELRHSAEDHFGAQSVHVLESDCANRVYRTPDGGTFVSGF